MAARLEICGKCGRHARIVLADGFIGPEFSYQEHGRQVISEGIRCERFTDEEAVKMGEALGMSDLPRTCEEADLELAWKIECWNALRVLGEIPETADDACEYLEEPPFLPIPDDFLSAVREHEQEERSSMN